ncbi:hypothetical protein EZS27_004437 [termite gut metagenome]|uniref:Uncharacterized protein n=1 Tax=termite gut metagenome TaxID=433724 RepID=A0A5J4SQA0_9ZZZZ
MYHAQENNIVFAVICLMSDKSGSKSRENYWDLQIMILYFMNCFLSICMEYHFYPVSLLLKF